ncbi:MAG: YkvA family protein [Candidatus Promineifilaceae bacterium]|nr:YkvA family protein [Candidatus Promineifilaceae bacterium]
MTKKSEEATRARELPEQMKDPGFWRDIWHQIRLVFSLLRDPEVPIYLKLLPLAAVFYVLFPIDFAPDFYPVLGQLDDLTALLVGAKVFVELAPPAAVARHMAQITGKEYVGKTEKEEDALKEAIIVDAEHEMVGDQEGQQEKE